MSTTGEGASEAGHLLAGRYRLRRHLGSGAMGAVWEATDEYLHRTVAVKELLVQSTLEPGRGDESRQRAMREGRIAARLHHPNAIAVHDVAEHAGQPLLVMEYLPSRSLAAVLGEATLTPEVAAGIGRQVATALATAHEVGIVHRDIKPGNVLLGDDGTVKITDFGISHAAGDVAVTKTGVLAGTPAYLAPEVARGYEPGPAADVFSLAATLYAAVEGGPPFGDSDNSIALLHTVAAGRFPPPAHAGRLHAVLLWMMRTEAAQRPAMAEVTEVLGAVEAGQSPPVPAGWNSAVDGEAGTQPLTRVPAWAASPAGQPTRRPTPTRLDGQSSAGGSGGTLAGSPGSGEGGSRRRRAGRRAGFATAGVLLALAGGGLLLAQTGGDPAPPPPTAPADMTRVVSDYYALLPEHTGNAWTRLGPGLQAQGRDHYEQQWGSVTDLIVTAPPRAVGQDTVLAGVELALPDGGKVREFHQLGMIPRGSAPLINSDGVLRREYTAPPPPSPPPRPPARDDEEEHREKKGKGESKKKGEPGNKRKGADDEKDEEN